MCAGIGVRIFINASHIYEAIPELITGEESNVPPANATTHYMKRS